MKSVEKKIGIAVLIFLAFVLITQTTGDSKPKIRSSATVSSKIDESVRAEPCEKSVVAPPVPCPETSGGDPDFKPIPPFRSREELIDILEQERMATGAEIGVLAGKFAKTTLSRWPSCKQYHLIDPWAHQENYIDVNNHGDAKFNQLLETVKMNVSPWKDKVVYHRMFSTEAAKEIPDNSLDYVYIDARHDRAGVLEDLETFWPKLRKGGIFAGHDYMTQAEVTKETPSQDWTVNFDGTKDKTGRVTKGAVDDFAKKVNRQLSISYRDPAWNTWALRK